MYVRHHIIDETPDIVINVVDSSNLERNLYLTTQLIDMNVRMVMALNMYDELEASGNTLDYMKLSELLVFLWFLPFRVRAKASKIFFTLLSVFTKVPTSSIRKAKVRAEVFE